MVGLTGLNPSRNCLGTQSVRNGGLKTYSFRSKDPNNRCRVPYYRKVIKLPHSTMTSPQESVAVSPRLEINYSRAEIGLAEKTLKLPQLVKSPSRFKGPVSPSQENLIVGSQSTTTLASPRAHISDVHVRRRALALKTRLAGNSDIQPVIEETWGGVDEFGNPVTRTFPA